jgi:hypothetical protein
MSYATAELLGRVERRPYQHHSAAIPYQNLDPVGAAATEHQHGTAKGVLPQCLFGQCRQRIGAFAEVDRPRYDQHSHAGRNRRLPLERTSRRWRGGMGCGRSRSIPGGGWLATAPWHCRRKGGLGFVPVIAAERRTGAIGGDAVGHRRDRNHRHRDPGRAGRGLAASARRAAGGEGGAVIPTRRRSDPCPRPTTRVVRRRR